jgi:hypothetical protein
MVSSTRERLARPSSAVSAADRRVRELCASQTRTAPHRWFARGPTPSACSSSAAPPPDGLPIIGGRRPSPGLVGLRSCSLLPGLEATGNDPQARVRQGALHAFESNVGLRIARRNLRHEMEPLVLDLSAGHGHGTRATRRADLSRCERVAALDGLRVNAAQIVRERAERRRLGAEALQLRVMPVTVRATPEHRLRQESFSPQRDQTASVEVLRMHGPQTHMVPEPAKRP